LGLLEVPKVDLRGARLNQILWSIYLVSPYPHSYNLKKQCFHNQRHLPVCCAQHLSGGLQRPKYGGNGTT
jgi:hypothetical protein